MKRLNTLLLLMTGFLVLIHATNADDNDRYKRPIRTESALIQVYVTQPEKMTTPQLRQILKKRTEVLGVEITVGILEYLPRGLSPVLLIDGNPVAHRYRIIDSNNRITTVGFLLDTPDMLKEEGLIAIQYGEDSDTRSGTVATVILGKTKILGMDGAEKAGIVLRDKGKK